MLLKSPVMITARLMPGVKIGDAFVAIEYDDCRDNRGANMFRWYIDLGDQEFTGDGLSGWFGLQGGLELLLSFLHTFAESWRYAGADGENADMFPAELAEWAMQNSDEIGMLQIELEETKGLIEE